MCILNENISAINCQIYKLLERVEYTKTNRNAGSEIPSACDSAE